MRIEQSPSSLYRASSGINAGLSYMGDSPLGLDPLTAAMGGVVNGLAEGLGSKYGAFTTVVEYNANSKNYPWSDPTVYRYSTYGYEKHVETRTDGARIHNWEKKYIETEAEALKILGVQ